MKIVDIDFRNPKNNDTLVSGLNYYSQIAGPTESKDWAISWLKRNHPEEAVRLANAKEYQFSNRGIVCRMIDKGLKVEKTVVDKLVKFFSEINPNEERVSYTDSVAPLPAKTAKFKPQIQNVIIEQMEDMQDAILSGKEVKAVSVPIDKVMVADAKTWCEKEIIELRERVAMYNEMIENIEIVYKKCGGVKQSFKPRRVPQSISKTIEKIDFLKKDEASETVSISPAKILGAKRVMVFTPKYKKVAIITAKPGETLSIVGKHIEGSDPKTSTSRTVKNPKEFFKSPNLFNEYKLLKSTINEVKFLLNANTMIIKAE